MRHILLLSAAILTAAAAPAPRAPVRRPPAPDTAAAPSGALVKLTPQPGTALDRTARELLADDLAEAKRAGETPLVLIGTAPLGAPGDRPALFAQLQSPRECGSAGCATSVFVFAHGAWRKVLDGVSGAIAVSPQRRQGMNDLTANTERYAWTGTAYADTHPAPEIDLRRRR